MERNLAHIALFAALIAALGLIPKFTLAFGVPITAQSMGVMLCGTILGAKRGALAVLLFLALVAVGFLIGWPIAAFVTGWIVERWNAPILPVATSAAIIGGVFTMYVFGILGMAYMLDKTIPAATMLSLSFIPGDLVKAIATGLITAALARTRPASILSRG